MTKRSTTSLSSKCSSQVNPRRSQSNFFLSGQMNKVEETEKDDSSSSSDYADKEYQDEETKIEIKEAELIEDLVSEF